VLEFFTPGLMLASGRNGADGPRDRKIFRCAVAEKLAINQLFSMF